MTLPEALQEARRRLGLTQAQMGERLGEHRVTVAKRESGAIGVPAEVLARLAERVGIVLVPNRRGWEILDPVEWVPTNPDRDAPYRAAGPDDGLPLIGDGGAGPPAAMLDHPEEWVSVDRDLRHWVDALIRVDGDSMAPLLQKGDLVGLRRGGPYRPGDVVAVMDLMDQDLLIMIFWGLYEDGSLSLASYNPAYEPILYEVGTAEVVGSIWGTWRGGPYRVHPTPKGP